MIGWDKVGLGLPDIMVPRAGQDKWAVVACDQYTGQPQYWKDVEQIVGDAPSALHITLPEVYLDTPHEAQKIADAQQTMHRYLHDGTLRTLPEGAIFVTRRVCGRTRQGLVLALDLECYDYSPQSCSLVRATEGTILERIPPRLRMREGACLELPHVIVLIDDQHNTVIEPLAQALGELVYDCALMCEGGRIAGKYLRADQLTGARDALGALLETAQAGSKSPLLYAVGDGNHSLATAKALWEKIKAQPDQAPEDLQNHPARYALVEIENIHDAGIEFEPIHRVLYDVPNDFLQQMELELQLQADFDAGNDPQTLPYITAQGEGELQARFAGYALPVSTLQRVLDAVLKKNAQMRIDYIHGEQAVRDICKAQGCVGFFLPPICKNDFFASIQAQGALERKTFSMGHANEKRYYMEARKIKNPCVH